MTALPEGVKLTFPPSQSCPSRFGLLRRNRTGHAAGSAASHDSGDLLAPQCLNVHRHGELLQQFVNQPVDRIVRNVGRNALYLDGSAAAKLQVETQRREIDRILLEQRIFVFRKRETLQKELLADRRSVGQGSR